MKKCYVSLTALALLSVSTLKAQVVYTDITDGIPTGIDFNQDGTNEFDIDPSSGKGDYITYFSGGADNNIHAVGTKSTKNWDVPNCVGSGFLIDASGHWEGQGDCSINAWGSGNATISVNQDEYLAMRFNLGGSDVYYGWVRFRMDGAGKVTYLDYAYASTPNTPIKAGASGTVGIPEWADRKISVYPNPAVDHIIIDTEGEFLSVQVCAMDGQVVLSQTLTGSMDRVDINHLPKGSYLLVLVDKEGRTYTRKWQRS